MAEKVYFTADGKVIFGPGGGVAMDPACCCEGTCAASVTFEQASIDARKCGFAGFADGTYEGMASTCDDETTFPGAPYVGQKYWLSKTTTYGACGELCEGSITTVETHTTWPEGCVASCELSGSIDCGEGFVFTPPNCDYIPAALPPHYSITASVGTEYTTAMLVEEVLAALAAASYAETPSAMAAFAISEDESEVAATKLRYKIHFTAPGSATWDEVFAPADGGSETTTHKSSSAPGGVETVEIIPDGTVEGTWRVENVHCAV
ncbi:MAG: hypothetical protein QOD99_1914 [Chthoniobacter sp.]|nr:hypothetical protein [Chthoniobacter sp.]